MRSAILFRITARSAVLSAPGRSGPCAASSASSTSSAVERAISVKISPVTGEGFSKYWPLTGGTYSPPMMFLSRPTEPAAATEHGRRRHTHTHTHPYCCALERSSMISNGRTISRLIGRRVMLLNARNIAGGHHVALLVSRRRKTSLNGGVRKPTSRPSRRTLRTSSIRCASRC